MQANVCEIIAFFAFFFFLVYVKAKKLTVQYLQSINQFICLPKAHNNALVEGTAQDLTVI